MATRLVETGWAEEIEQALGTRARPLIIVSPFIKTSAAQRFVRAGLGNGCRVITRFNLEDFASEVSDLDALSALCEAGATVRGVRDLHAKMYVFGQQRAVVTSANLTEAALTRNHELGFVSDDSGVIEGCIRYAERLWAGCEPNLTVERLTEWRSIVMARAPSLAQARSSLADFGARIAQRSAEVREVSLPSIPGAVAFPPTTASATHNLTFPETPHRSPSLSRLRAEREGYIVFYGGPRNLAIPSTPIAELVDTSGAFTSFDFGEPKPIRILTGSPIFVGRWVTSDQQDDVMLLGRGVAQRNDPRQNIPLRDLTYLPYETIEFLDGVLSDGVSLRALISTVGDQWFEARRGRPDPLTVHRSRKYIPLSRDALTWLVERMKERFAARGALRRT